MKLHPLPATVALLLAIAAPAAAQEEPSPDGDIVVTARTLETEDVVDQAREVAASESRRDPLARFERAVCPGVMGLKVEFAVPIVERMRFNAQRLGLRLPEADKCEANVLAVFVNDVDAFMAQLFESDDGSAFGTLGDRERRLLKAERGPTRAWSVTSKRSADGFLVQMDRSAVIRETGRINIGSREDMELSIVLIDLRAIAGMTTQQLADYATMRAFAETRPPGEEASLATILTLFSPDGADLAELTPFDLAYLRNLYSGEASVAASRKLSGIASALERGEPGL